MRILVSGASGLVGKRLCERLEGDGHTVARLVRNSTGHTGDAVYWDPENGVLAGEHLDGFAAAVHLAGEPIAAGRWTEARKARIRDSRVNGTQLLCDRIASAENGPRVLIAASALGYYGDRGDEIVTESSPAGTGFLADVCKAWEGATQPAIDAGVRVVNLRIGLVLAANGGALEKMLPPFKLGMGGPLGDGSMWMSWIHLEDLVGAIVHALDNDALRGPVNGFAPNPVTNKTFTRTLGQVLHRPAVIPVPAFTLRLALGEMADALLLASLRGQPARLQETGYPFQYPDLESALKDLLA